MDDKSWIKLYRKIALHDIMGDGVALQIFIYLLVRCRGGKMNVSRYTTSRFLNLNPETFRKGLKRLVENYEICTTKGTNRFTTVSILNWDKYQANGTNSDTNEVPTKYQPSTTYIKNKEIRIENINNNSVTSKTSRCPLEISKDNLLKEKYPNGHKECIEFIDSVASSKGHKFINYQKQIRFVHQCLRSGFDFVQMDRAINEVEKDKFYMEKGWDFANIASFLERK